MAANFGGGQSEWHVVHRPRGLIRNTLRTFRNILFSFLVATGRGSTPNRVHDTVPSSTLPTTSTIPTTPVHIAIKMPKERIGKIAVPTTGENISWWRAARFWFWFFFETVVFETRLYRALRGYHSYGSRGFIEDRVMDIITGRAPPPARADHSSLRLFYGCSYRFTCPAIIFSVRSTQYAVQSRPLY